MKSKSDEQKLLETIRNIRQVFEARFDRYTPDERTLTAKAIRECAAVLSRRLGHTSDNYIFGHDVFSGEEATRWVAVMRRLQTHAEESQYHRGVTAALILRGLANIVYAQKVSTSPATKALLTQELTTFGELMERTFAEGAVPETQE